MEPHQRTHFRAAAALLAVALTLSGLFVPLISPICMKWMLPRWGLATLPEVIPQVFGGATLLGFALAWCVPCSRGSRWIAMLLLLGWATVAGALLVEFADFHDFTDAQFWLSFGTEACAVMLSSTCAIIVPIWVGRLAGFRNVNPLFLFAFLFLGYLIGFIAYPLAVEPYLFLAQHWFWLNVGFACTGLVYLAIFCIFRSVPVSIGGETVRSPAPSWLRRLRWLVLGGLPGCVVFGLTSYVSTDLSPIPLFWLLTLSLHQVTWVVAFARMSNHNGIAIAWLLQALAVVTLWLLLLLVAPEFPGNALWWATAFLAIVSWAVLVPHRITLIGQSSLLAVVFLQMYAEIPFGIFWAILAHVSLTAMTCRGCHGEAVKDAPGPDRLPEFILLTQAGFFVCGFAFMMLPPILFPQSIIEYPVVLVAALVLRAVPWPLRLGSEFEKKLESPPPLPLL